MFEQIAIYVVLMIISTAITASMAPKPERLKPGELNIPRAQEGVVIGVIFGEILIKDAHVVDAFGFQAIPMKSKGGKKG